MFRWIITIVLSMTLMLVAFQPLDASRVTPMLVDLKPFGRGSIARIQFTNTAERSFPVEVRAFRGVISEEGELELIPADEDFLIFPPQMVVDPLGEQVFRAQYVGDPDITEAQVYYLSIKQLPIELEPGAPKVQVLVTFNVLLNVEPIDVESDPTVDTVEASQREGEAGLERGVRARVVNDGQGMLKAGRYSWSISGRTADGENFTRKFTPSQIANMIGVGVVAPGLARQFFVPLDLDVDPDGLTVRLD